MVNMILKCLAEYNDVLNIRYTNIIPQTIKAVFPKSIEFLLVHFSSPLVGEPIRTVSRSWQKLSYVFFQNLQNLDGKHFLDRVMRTTDSHLTLTFGSIPLFNTSSTYCLTSAVVLNQ